MTKYLKIVSSVLFFIWFFGALAFSLNLEFQRKAECIRNEGPLKGWLGCETEKSDRYLGARFTINFLSELSWPLRLFPQ